MEGIHWPPPPPPHIFYVILAEVNQFNDKLYDSENHSVCKSVNANSIYVPDADGDIMDLITNYGQLIIE